MCLDPETCLHPEISAQPLELLVVTCPLICLYAVISAQQVELLELGIGSVCSVDSPNVVLVQLRKQSRRLIVFYGSQTGTAEEFAGKLT